MQMMEITKLAISTSTFGLNKVKACYSFTQSNSRVWQTRAGWQLRGHQKLDSSYGTLLWSSSTDPKWLLDFNPSHLHPSQQEEERQKGTPFSFEEHFYEVLTFQFTVTSCKGD